MSQDRTFEPDDFELEPRGRRLFDVWRARQPLESPLCPFEIDLDTPPDTDLLRSVNELVTFVTANSDVILDTVYDQYSSLAEERGWMKSCGVPRNLRVDQVSRYLRRRSISVRRNRLGVATGTICISPQWEPEHGIHLRVVNGRLAPAPV